MQKAFKDLLTESVLNRRKLPPFSNFISYFKKELLGIVEGVLTSQITTKKYLNHESVLKLIDNVKSSKNPDDNSCRQLLFFTTFEIWNRMFLEGDVKKPNLSINKYI